MAEEAVAVEDTSPGPALAQREAVEDHHSMPCWGKAWAADE